MTQQSVEVLDYRAPCQGKTAAEWARHEGHAAVAQLIEAHLAQSPERMASEEKPGTDEPAPQAAGIGSCVGVDAADGLPSAPGASQAVQEFKDAPVEQAREKAKRQIAEAQLATREAASATAEAAAE
eukprot:COSAG01_NODE_37356_length_504_cov_4.866667_1_plen_126_part_01